MLKHYIKGLKILVVEDKQNMNLKNRCIKSYTNIIQTVLCHGKSWVLFQNSFHKNFETHEGRQ